MRAAASTGAQRVLGKLGARGNPELLKDRRMWVSMAKQRHE